MKLLYKIALVAILFAILLTSILYLGVRNVATQIKNETLTGQTKLGAISVIASLNQSRTLNYNNSQIPLVYTLVTYTVVNTTNAKVSMDVYTKNPIQQIYLVNVSSYCITCFNETQLQLSLKSSLSYYNLIRNSSSFNYIPISKISSIPGNSTVIIPSGLMPTPLVNSTNVSSSLFRLLRRGDTVVYVGQNLSRSIGQKPVSLIIIDSQQISSQLAASNLGSVQIANSSLLLQQNISRNYSFKKPTFSFVQGSQYGNVTYTNSANGTMIAFPNNPTSSWNSTSSMAADIARVINTRFWMKDIGHSTSTLNFVASRTAGLFGMFASVPAANKSSGILNSTYTLVVFTGMNATSSAVQQMSFRNNYTSRAALNVPAAIGETQSIPIVIQLSNSVLANFNNTNLINLHLDVYDRNLSYLTSIPIGSIPHNVSKFVENYAFSLPSAYYILSLRDLYSNYYTGALFNLTQATISFASPPDFKNGTFVFSIYSNGVPVTNASYKININGAYNSNGMINGGTLVYSLPKGTIVNFGHQRFNFYMFNTNTSIGYDYEPLPGGVPIFYVEFAIAIIVVVLLNLILKPPNRDDYYVDLPDFPPSKREKIKVQKSTMLGVFNKVNYSYRWKYMPLTTEEIKSGVSGNIRLNNMPVSITVQNANTILSNLIQDGDLSTALGYYAPKDWIDASGHSIEYLIMFRKLRDYCISHAMLFTDLDSNEKADMLITKDGKEISVYIYTGSDKMKKVSISRDAKTVILFLNEDTMIDFDNKIYVALGEEAEIMKLGIDYSYVKLLDIDHLDELAL